MTTNTLILNLYGLGAILAFLFIGLSLVPSIGVTERFRKSLGCFTCKFKNPAVEGAITIVILGACVLSSWLFVLVFIFWNVTSYIVNETRLIANRTNVPVPFGYNKILIYEDSKGDPDPKELVEFFNENIFMEKLVYLETIKVLGYRKDVFLAMPELEGRDLNPAHLPTFFRYLSEIESSGVIGVYPERVKDYLKCEN